MVYKRDYIFEQIGGQETESETHRDLFTMAQRMVQIMSANTGSQRDLEELDDLLDEMDYLNAQGRRVEFNQLMMRTIQYLIDHGVDIDEG